MHVRNEESVSLEWLDEALPAKLLHRPRNGFSRGADLVRELFLSPVELDLNAALRGDSAPLGVPDEQHCKPCRDIAKRERFREVNQMPQPASQGAYDRVRDVGLVAIEILEAARGRKTSWQSSIVIAEAGYGPPSNIGSSATVRPGPSI